MNLLTTTTGLLDERVPRVCGDEPQDLAFAMLVIERSPRMRG